VPAGVTRRRPMRLLMTTDAVGGVWPYASDLARGLAERQVETTLVVLGPAPAAEALESVLAIPGLRVVITGLPLDWTAATAEEVAEAAEHVAAIASDIRAAVVHLNSPALAALASFTAPVVGVCHSCLATWWDAIRSGPLPSDFVWRARMVEQGYRACDALAAPTAAFARITAATYRIPEPRVVRNGRRDRSIERAVKPADVVFTAGRLWDEGKNLATLDAAAARLGVPVLAAGPVTGPNGSAISLRHIRSVGSLDESEIREWLGQQPIFASVPRYEPFGLAILEAAQAGCALVLSDIPTLRELWDGAAVFVAPHDQMALAGAIEALAQDRARRESLGDAARKCAERYSVERMTAGMLDLYEAVLARDAVRPREAVA
jgi:glycogen synthase